MRDIVELTTTEGTKMLFPIGSFVVGGLKEHREISMVSGRHMTWRVKESMKHIKEKIEDAQTEVGVQENTTE